MNREEVIRTVEGCLTDYFPMEDCGKVEEIIKALRQELCEDAISRKAMLDYQQYLQGKISNEENYKLWKFIKDLPSVMPNCDFVPQLMEGTLEENLYNYCPKCDKKLIMKVGNINERTP